MEHLKRLGDASGNMDNIPDLSSVHAVPWAGFGQYKVGEILCDLMKRDGNPFPSDPRHIARTQLNKLEAMGMEFMSSYELEFILHDRKTLVPVFDADDIFSNLVLAEHEKMFFQIDSQMLEAGIDCECIQTELGPGQFEVTMVPIKGLAGADKAVQLKQGIKEIAHQYGLEASFMGKPFPEQSGNGAHFNFSIWNKKDNTNAFYDPEGAFGLSKFAQHWIAGTMKHSKSLTALLSPTVNCYRRLQGDWAPSKVFWGIENRNSALRVKVGSQKSTYMENRLPSGSANQYLVMAAVIAAGLDGVKHQLPLPEEGNKHNQAEILPLSLGEALQCLEDDKFMVEALGEEFISWYCLVKRMVDLTILKDSEMTKNDDEALAKERHMYNITI